MKLIYRILHQDSDSRDGIIAVTSVIGIAVNLLIAAMKIAVGIFASSIAIVSEGANNAADGLSSVLALAGTKIAGKHPDSEHPFGYRRIEYLTGLTIAVMILVAGIEMLIGSVRLIITPEPLNVSVLAIVLVAISAVIKFFLGLYTIRMGKKSGSSALVAVGTDGRNDSFASIITIASSLIFLIFSISLDAYAGIIISVLIIKAGIDSLKETLSELIGRSGEKDLANSLYREIRSTDGIITAADMMLHNYGPDTWSGSANLEIDHKKTTGEVFQILHDLQLRIMHKYGVTMVFGVYAVDYDNEDAKVMRTHIGSFVSSHEHVKSFHALYVEPRTGKIYCDLIVDYMLRDWDALKNEFTEYMTDLYPGKEIDVTIETEFV